MLLNHADVGRKTAGMNFPKFLVDQSFLFEYFIAYLLIS